MLLLGVTTLKTEKNVRDAAEDEEARSSSASLGRVEKEGDKRGTAGDFGAPLFLALPFAVAQNKARGSRGSLLRSGLEPLHARFCLPPFATSPGAARLGAAARTGS